jgi:RNA polymerase sigma factor (sigma-70 family)
MHERTADDERLGALMRAAQAGDAAAYLTLLQEIAPRVRQTILRRRGPTAAAGVEDLVQDVLLSVHVARASYDPARPFLPWLLAIVRNRLADGARRYARQAAHEVQVENLDLACGVRGMNAPSEPLDGGQALRAAVEALPRRQRQAVELLKLRELSLREAAAATGMSVAALKVATHRAMAALRRVLAAGETHGH